MVDSVLIYVLSSTRNGEFRYVGQRKISFERRLYYHIYKSRTKCTTPLSKWIRREINEGYKIVETPLCIGQRDVDEIFYIERAKQLGWRLLNSTEGGDGGATRTGKKHSEETKAKMRASSIGKNKGIVRSEEFKKQVSETMRRKYQGDPEMRANLAKARELGLPLAHSQETREKIRKALTGNPKLKEGVKRGWEKRRLKEK